MTTEIWATNIASSILILIGGWFIISYLFPLLENVLNYTIKDQKVLHSFMGILNIFVLWMVAESIVRHLVDIDNMYLNYLTTIQPALDLFVVFLPYLTYIILGWFIIVGLQRKTK